MPETTVHSARADGGAGGRSPPCLGASPQNATSEVGRRFLPAHLTRSLVLSRSLHGNGSPVRPGCGRGRRSSLPGHAPIPGWPGSAPCRRCARRAGRSGAACGHPPGGLCPHRPTAFPAAVSRSAPTGRCCTRRRPGRMRRSQRQHRRPDRRRVRRSSSVPWLLHLTYAIISSPIPTVSHGRWFWSVFAGEIPRIGAPVRLRLCAIRCPLLPPPGWSPMVVYQIPQGRGLSCWRTSSRRCVPW